MLVDWLFSLLGVVPPLWPGPPVGPVDLVLADLDDDVGELLGIDQPAQRVDRQLKLLAGGNRRLADLAGRDLQVLLADGGHDVLGRDAIEASFSVSSQARML